ncbi:M14 family zinc carboxypeptidase [Wenzhouxiangella marina]|uniref:Molting fluid carboxypeptidase A, putative n=1 Tax=Wenzhouxiangella marina TaxID=1579979 RepID=A0A0K0XW84_9GAMM|nr:M14 family zinc carboxypeptidase [Wenzhouxiangella marina]AKS41887.1 Molting fluid carboxypeptidase A, putative [Wenzhouxiangella marina]MBB6086346.1 hypothetical protein [Wenzhouxiangella marina]
MSMLRIASLVLVLALSSMLQANESTVIKIYDVPRADYNRLRYLGDFWGINWREGYVNLYVTQRGLAEVQALGYRVEIDREKTDALIRFRDIDREAWRISGVGGVPGFPCYRTVDETNAALSGLASAHPNLARWEDIGDTWRKANGQPGGDDINVLVIGNQSSPHPQAPLVIMAAQHARELTTAESATRFAEWLVNGYGNDATATWLLDHREIHIIAQHNPDGRREVEGGESFWRKNANTNACPSGTVGVDLNRNSNVYWGQFSDTNSCSETYRGPGAGSEPETQAVQDYLDTVFTDYRDNAADPGFDALIPDTAEGIFLSLHSYSELILFPWEGRGGGTSNHAANHEQLAWLGRKMGFFTDYQVGRDILYSSGGTMPDYAHGMLGVAAYTYEIGTSFQQSCSSFENDIWADILASLIYNAKAAARPYAAPSGPDVVNLTAVFDASQGQLLIQGLADDTRYARGGVSEGPANDPITSISSVTASLDLPPALAGTTYSLNLDGSGTSVSFSGDLSIPGLDLSQPRLLFVQATDASGQAGVLEAVWIQEQLASVAPGQLLVTVPGQGMGLGQIELSNSGSSRALAWSIASDLPAQRGSGYDPALDETLSLSDFVIQGNGSYSEVLPAGVSTVGSVVGFSFSGDVTGVSNNQTWASDLQLTITAPGGSSYAVGGFQTGNPPWDFDGSGSNSDGSYSSTHIDELPFGPEGVADDGNWTFEFLHTYNDAMTWSNVTVTLHKQAPPICVDPQGVAWLSISPSSGSLPAGQSLPIQIEVDGSLMPGDNAQALLCLSTDDPLLPLAVIEVTATRSADPLFEDRFEQ